jgi:hypothetical protein
MKRYRIQSRFRTHTRSGLCLLYAHIAIFPNSDSKALKWRCWCGALKARKFGRKIHCRTARNPRGHEIPES